MTAIRTRMGAVYWDNLEPALAGGAREAINTVPQDGEHSVLIATTIKLQIVDTTGTAIDSTRLQIYLCAGDINNEELAFDTGAGGFQTGYEGTAIGHTSPGSAVEDELWLDFAPIGGLLSDTIYQVRVEEV